MFFSQRWLDVLHKQRKMMGNVAHKVARITLNMFSEVFVKVELFIIFNFFEAKCGNCKSSSPRYMFGLGNKTNPSGIVFRYLKGCF